MLVELLDRVPGADLILVPSSFKEQVTSFDGLVELPAEPPPEISTTCIAEPPGRIHQHVYRIGEREVPLAFDRFMRQREIFAIQRTTWALCWFRPIKLIPLAKTGDAESHLLTAEYTLECRNEARNGAIYDLEAPIS